MFRNLLPLALLVLPACSGSREARPVDLELAELDGGLHRPLELAPEALRVVVFITHDCPIANAYAPEINRIVEEYGSQGVDFDLVHVEPEIDHELVSGHARDHGFECDVLLDPEHGLVDALGAEVTPEAFVLQGLDGGYVLRYSGRIDDRNVAFGKKRVAAGEHELRDALDALLAGELPAVERTKAVGCYIE